MKMSLRGAQATKQSTSIEAIASRLRLAMTGGQVIFKAEVLPGI
jgi:hypothetical protein